MMCKCVNNMFFKELYISKQQGKKQKQSKGIIQYCPPPLSGRIILFRCGVQEVMKLILYSMGKFAHELKIEPCIGGPQDIHISHRKIHESFHIEDNM